MKRFMLVFVLAVVALVASARVLAPLPCPQRPTLAQRILHFVAGWWITHRLLRDEAPAPAIETSPLDPNDQLAIEATPPLRGDTIARQPMRATSADGTPRLDHAAGW